MNSKIPCTVLVLTLNSAKTLKRAIESVRDFSDILVLDGNSTDGTLEIAKSFGARVISQVESEEKNIRIQDYSNVRNKGITHAQFPWILCLDSDEYLSTESVEEIRVLLEVKQNFPGVYALPRKYVLDGQVIERASRYPNYQNRLFHRDAVFGYVKPVHENLKLKPGKVIERLEFPEYVPLESLLVAKEKSNKYVKIQIDALKNLSFFRLIKGVRSNLKTLIGICIHLVLSYRGKGKHLPLAYEMINMRYHSLLLLGLFKNYFRKFFHV